MHDDARWLSLRLDFWDDAVGAFEPAKVIRQLRRAFPEAEVDPTDHQRARLLRELEAWSRAEQGADLRDSLVGQSWGTYRTNGPMYRFVVPFSSGHRVEGSARRLSVNFYVPAGLPPECRDQLLAFLRSLRMGEPVLDDEPEDASPDPPAP
jgi:hypothetical protein